MRIYVGNPSAYLFNLVATCDIVCYWAGTLLGLHHVAFVLGATLAFYMPGAIIVAALGEGFRRASVEERAAASVILSVAFTGLAALALDFTPLGITQVTLAAADTALFAMTAGALMIARRRVPLAAATQVNLERTAVLLAVAVTAGGWGLGAHGFGRAVVAADNLLLTDESGGYSEFMGSCTGERTGRDTALRFTSISHGDRHASYHILVHIDGHTALDAKPAGRVAPYAILHYRFVVRGPWREAQASLVGRTGRSALPNLRVTLRRQACAPGRIGPGADVESPNLRDGLRRQMGLE